MRRNVGDSRSEDENLSDNNQHHEDQGRQRRTQEMTSPREEYEAQQRPHSPTASDVGYASQPSLPVVGLINAPSVQLLAGILSRESQHW